MYGAYDDEDNLPMCDEMYDRIEENGHNPTVYGSYAEMRAAERGDLDAEEDEDFNKNDFEED